VAYPLNEANSALAKDFPLPTGLQGIRWRTHSGWKPFNKRSIEEKPLSKR
jgi:hypothetical protein